MVPAPQQREGPLTSASTLTEAEDNSLMLVLDEQREVRCTLAADKERRAEKNPMKSGA